MRIGIDAHALGTGAGGNESYMRSLLRALGRHAPQLDVVALVGPEYAADRSDPMRQTTYTLPVRSSYLRVPLALPWAAWRARLDLLHVQFNAPPWCPCPYVTSVHDLCWERYPEYLPARDRHRLTMLMPGTIRRAARIFALTHAIKDEIAAEYRVPPDRIDVVSPAADPVFAPVRDEARLAAVRTKYGLPQGYVLYVGALQPRKNLARLAAAFARLEDRGLTHRLVIVGKRAWLYGDMLAQIEALKLGDRLVFTGYVDGADLPALYTAASAFAYVSLYEGFGIPVLEALACATPTLIGNDPAVTEVAGDAALPCDPRDISAIEAGLARILTDASLRADLREKGPRRASVYSEEVMAAGALQAYERLSLRQ
ncbi:MAG: glycosyltransferase family 4 protein [Candidatus Hydrogenedentes bacterium]|nr:glycosyltransferase family 4 protein [Candidatus Hydrogenedentota bacterium]